MNKRGFGNFFDLKFPATSRISRFGTRPYLTENCQGHDKSKKFLQDKRDENFQFSQFNFFPKNRRGSSLLVENVVFIILNVVFLSILIVFIFNQSSSGRVLEESYAKEIALIADYAKPEMIIKIDLRKGFDLAEKNGVDFGDVLKVDGNVVFVKLSSEGGYSYSFFNEVKFNDPYPETNSENDYTGFYILTFSEAENE